MRRRNMNIQTDRQNVKEIDFEALMREFDRQSQDKKRDRGNRKKRKHKK